MARRSTRSTSTRRPVATPRRTTSRRRSAPLDPVIAKEVAGVVLAGLGLLSLVSVSLVWAGRAGGAPLLLGVDRLLVALFGGGIGWLAAAAGLVALGGLLISPRTPPVGRWQAVAWLLAVASAYGLLHLGGGGGVVGRLVAAVPLRLAGPVGAGLVLTLVLVASLLLAVRQSLGSGVLHVLTTSRRAMRGESRLSGAGDRFRTTWANLAAAMREHRAGRQAAPEPAPAEASPAMPAFVPPAAPAETPRPPDAPLPDDDVGEDGEDGPEGEETPERPRIQGVWIREETREWTVPQTSLLDAPTSRRGDSHDEVTRNSRIITAKLAEFNVKADVVGARPGPTVTTYDVKPGSGVPVRKVIALARDISSALGTDHVRFEPIVEGRPGVIGVEVPNKNPVLVPFRVVVEAMLRSLDGLALGVALGNDAGGKPEKGDLQRMPHLLIAGATGQGKSVCINTLIGSLLFQLTPAQLRLVLIDPKRVELPQYNGLPHLAVPVIVEPHQAIAALRWAVYEMERRYKVLAHAGVRNVAVYNERAAAAGRERLPYVVIVIDELADLMMVAAGEIEELLCRLAQLARAAGIHLVVATQRPSTDIITGLIKANFPSRIAFAVGSQVDSRVILDRVGAEKLLGRGDMLYQPVDAGSPTRIQGAFISDREVESLVQFWAAQGAPRFIDEVLSGAVEPAAQGDDQKGQDRRLDPMFARAARMVAAEGMASVSQVQRKFNVGYSRAGRIIDQLAEHRVISGHQGSKSREVLMNLPDVDRLLEQLGLEG